MSTSTNLYEDILGNIDADKKAWCQGDWCERENGKPVSRCLVEHVDLALGTTYRKPNGAIFVSKDKRKWARRSRVMAHLASLLPEHYRDFPEEDYRVLAPSEVDLTFANYGHRGPGYDAAGDLISFNDDESKTNKTKVRNLLKRAAKRFPED